MAEPLLAAVVLAAGAGTRFGVAPKLAAAVGGEPLLAYALRGPLALLHAGVAAEAVVVLGAHRDQLAPLVPPEVTVVVNHRWREGLAASLAVAINHARAASYAAVIVGLGDQPNVPVQAWQAVVAGSGITVASYRRAGSGEQWVRGHPVRLDRAVWNLLAVRGDRGARSVMDAHPELVTEVRIDADHHCLDDIDTSGDLERLRYGAPEPRVPRSHKQIGEAGNGSFGEAQEDDRWS